MSSGVIRRASAFVLGLAVAASGQAAWAQNDAPVAAEAGHMAHVSVAPLRIEMNGTERAAVLRVVNPSAAPIGVQVRAFDWSQQAGEDIYEASRDIQISPSIIMIAPGDTQIFRVLTRDLPTAGERRYRIAIDQLPDPDRVRNGQAQARLRFTIPMFVDRDSAAPAALAWTIENDRLLVSNAGQQTARMVNLALSDGAGDPLALDTAGLQYLMGGQSFAWDLPQGCPSGPVRLRASIDGETVDETVPARCN